MASRFSARPSSLARRIILRDIGTIFETPENWTIYRKPDLTDQTFVDLCDGIRESGIIDPLEISSDGFIISGHRRYIAATHCGLTEVPCFVDRTVVMGDLTVPERVALLTKRNKGIRIKSDGELYLEAAAAVDPNEAVRKAKARKSQVLNKTKTCALTEVQIAGSIARTDPTGERADMLKAVLEILDELRSNNYLPTSQRSIHYKLLAKNVRTSNRKSGYIYGMGGYCRMSPLVFSLVPRSQAWWGVAK